MSLVLMDTNIILRGAQLHPDAINAQIELRRRGDQPCLVAQNLIEFRSVATRPASVNGLGMSQTDADAEIVRLKTLYPVFADVPAILPEWGRLVTTCGAARICLAGQQAWLRSCRPERRVYLQWAAVESPLRRSVHPKGCRSRPIVYM